MSRYNVVFTVSIFCLISPFIALMYCSHFSTWRTIKFVLILKQCSPAAPSLPLLLPPSIKSAVMWGHACSCSGSLALYMKMRSGERLKLFSDSLSQGGMWRHGSGNIRSTLEEWQVWPGLQINSDLSFDVQLLSLLKCLYWALMK